MGHKIDLSERKSELGVKDQIKRLLWGIVWGIFARPLPRTMLNGWKILLLKMFGAKLHLSATVYSSAKIYAPWNLEMHEHSCIGPEVDCYNVDKITIGAHAVVSQKAYLCTASHDITDSKLPLIMAPIVLEDQSWVTADTFVAMGVTIGKGAVVGARAAVFKDVEPWSIVGGNPAKFIKKRIVIR